MVLFGTPTASSADSLAFFDTLYHNKGLALVPGSITMRTNEGVVYRRDVATKVPFSDAFDSDAGWRYTNGSDTVIRINFGIGATQYKRGQLSNTSRPSVFGSTCIIMATYRVVVYAPYDTKINFRTGGITYKDGNTGILQTANFVADSFIVYNSPGLCPNAVSASNAIGVEFNGTFGTPSNPAPLLRNRGTTSYTPTYTYSVFATGTGPGDNYYGITNNTSAKFTTSNAYLKPDANGYRVFNLWDITGDHTGATNTAKGNPPCDTTQPVSATNPCGYMLVVNAAYKADTAFNYNVTNLCPNTYYEISAWFKNICIKCSGDSLGNSSGSASYKPAIPGDTSGVKPNIAFDVNGTDYYTTGDISYKGTGTQAGSDSTNQWVKRGFTYLTGASQTSFDLALRNNAPGGGGDDWAVDDIGVVTCLPNMSYSPSLNPNVCQFNPLTVYDTVRSYFNNYVYYKWQRSTDGGTNWSDVTGTLGPSSPSWNGSAYEYVSQYTIPPANSDTTDSGDKYRLVTATTSSNMSSSSCISTDGVSIVSINVLSCDPVLSTDLISFSGKLLSDHSTLYWTTSKEETPLTYIIEKSNDGINFSAAGSVYSLSNSSNEINYYSFTDPSLISGKAYYRIVMVAQNGSKKYSRSILLSNMAAINFDLSNVINPFHHKLDFEITAPSDQKINTELIDLGGKVIKRNSYLVHSGVNMLSITETGSLPPGIYILRIKNNDQFINRKVLKQN